MAHKATAQPFDAAADGVRVRVRVSPKASRNGVAGLKDTADGPALAVSVTAVPEGGKANAAVVKLLAKEWKVARGDIDVISGAASRNKVLKLKGNPVKLAQGLALWMERFHD